MVTPVLGKERFIIESIRYPRMERHKGGDFVITAEIVG